MTLSKMMNNMKFFNLPRKASILSNSSVQFYNGSYVQLLTILYILSYKSSYLYSNFSPPCSAIFLEY